MMDIHVELKAAYEKISKLESLLMGDGNEWETSDTDSFDKWILMQKIDGIVRVKNELFECRPLTLTGYQAVKISIQFTQS